MGLPPEIDGITFYLIGPRLDVSMCVCHVNDVWHTLMTFVSASTPEQTTKTSAMQQCGQLRLIVVDSLENFAMLVVSLLILLAGALIFIALL